MSEALKSPALKGGALRRVGRGVAWIGKKWVWTAIGDWSEVKQNAKRICQQLKSLTGRQYRQESFTQAVERLNLNDAALAARARYLHALSILFGLMTIVAGIFLVMTPWSPNPINHFLVSLGVLTLSGSRFLVTRFRVAQIHHKKLFGFKSWLLRQRGHS